MNNPNIVAAIVLGSSSVTGLVAVKDNDGTIRVKSQMTQPSSDFIGKGRVLNVEKMTACLTCLKTSLQEASGYRLTACYVAINCQGIRSITNEVSINLPSSELVTDDMLGSINVKNKEHIPAERTILEAIPLEYRLGAQGTLVSLEPKGMQTDRLQAKFLNIVCNASTINTFYTCLRKAGIEVAGNRVFVGVHSLAQLLTNEQERSTGCVIVDMGAETTTVAIYKGKLLRHLVVIPLGGENISRDIESVFNVEREEAEELKRTYGYPDNENFEDQEVKLRDGNRTAKLSDLYGVIDARIEEIVQNVKHQIGLSGYNHETLVNGLYICGGASHLKNVIAAYTTHFKEWNVRIVKTVNRLPVATSEPNFNASGLFNTCLSLIASGEVNCNGGKYEGGFYEDQVADSAEPVETAEERAQREAAEAETARKAAAEAAEAARKKAEEEAAEAARKKAEEEAAEAARKKEKRAQRWRGVKDFFKGLVSEDEL